MSMDERQLKGLVNAPEFPLGLSWLNTDYPLRLGDFKGKIVLLDFWTFGCINCHHVFDEIKQLQKEYADYLVTIGVHSAKFLAEKNTNHIRSAILQHDLTHPIVNDFEMKVWKQYAIRAWPSFALVNPAGRLVGQTSGEGIYNRVKPVIEQLIELFEQDQMFDKTKHSFSLEKEICHQSILKFPSSICVSKQEEKLFIADTSNHRIIVTNLSGKPINVIGSGQPNFRNGSFEEAAFNCPRGLFQHEHLLYVADSNNHAIRVIDFDKQNVNTICGDGKQAKKYNIEGNFNDISLNSPWDIARFNDRLLVAMAGSHQIWELDLSKQKAKPLIGHSAESLRDGAGLEAMLAQPYGIYLDGEELFFVDSESSALRKVDLLPSLEVKTLIGQGLFDFGDEDGCLDTALLQHPSSVVKKDKLLYVADTYNHKIKVYDLQTSKITTLIGKNGAGVRDGSFDEAQINEPTSLAINGDHLFLCDSANHLIRVANLKKQTLSTLPVSGLPPSNNQDYGVETKTLFFGKQELLLSLKLPEAYKLSELMNSFVILKDGNNEVKQAIFCESQSTCLIPLTSASVQEVELFIYFCKKHSENEAACFIHYEMFQLVKKGSEYAAKHEIMIADKEDSIFL